MSRGKKMTIREKVEKAIDDYDVKDLAVLEHTSPLYNFVELWPDGDLVQSAEASNSSWPVLPGTNQSIPLLWRHYNGCKCNCDWCAEWEEGEQTESQEEFIRDCLDNNDNGEYIRDEMYERLRDIPYGFFDDEKGEADE